MEKVTVILKGGPGSGHFGHKGRPGEVGGSLPKDASAAAPRPKEPKFIGNFTEQERATALKNLNAMCKELGYPVNKIIIDNSEGYGFKVGETAYDSAAQYDPRNGMITFYKNGSWFTKESDNVTFDQQIAAHEIMHARFHQFQKIAQRQDALLTKALAAGKVLPPEELWAAEIYYKYYQSQEKLNSLFATGASPYGISYIKVAKKSPYGEDQLRAVSENLSEIAARPHNTVSREWGDLYKELNEAMIQHGYYDTYNIYIG